MNFMKKVFFVLVIMLCFSFSFVDAFTANVTLIDEIGSFTGAVLRLKSSMDGDNGDKIFPSNNLASFGIIEFEIETSLSEIYFNLAITQNGQPKENVDVGPFAVNGSGILVDMRPKKEVEVVKDVAVEVLENESVESINNESVEDENISEEAVVVIEEDLEDENNLLVYLTGAVVAVKESVASWGYFVFGGLGVLLLAVFGGVILKKRGKKKKNILSDDDKELESMEKRVKETAEKIGEVKSRKEKKVKLEKARAKLREEERELRELEEDKEEKAEEKREDLEEKREEKEERERSKED